MKNSLAKLTFCIILLANCCYQLLGQTTVLLVGTMHSFEDTSTAIFEPIRQKLIAFNPDAIYIESIPVWDTASLKAVRTNNMQVAEQLRQEKGWQAEDLPAYTEKWLTALASNEDDLVARSQLANTLYAQNDFWNAYYHWFVLHLQLQEHPELQQNPSITKTFALNKIHERTTIRQATTEYGHIVFPIAARLGHLYLYNIDERSDDAAFAKEGKKLAWRLALNFKIFKLLKMYKQEKKLLQGRPGNEVIEYINTNDFRQRLQQIFDDAPIKYSKSKRTKRLIALWEKRNQEMANRIAQTNTENASNRIVVFFGAAHVGPVKRYLEAKGKFNVITLDQL